MAGNMFTEPIPYISIHALRKESDLDRAANGGVESDFNPRSP